MQASLYVMDKRPNSTKRPTDSTEQIARDITIIMTESVVRIRVRLNVTVNNEQIKLMRYNYMYIPHLRRFYWIRDWEITAVGLMIADCEVDVLGSFQEAILSSSAYVERSDNQIFYNKYINDCVYLATSRHKTHRMTANSPYLSSSPSEWTYIISVVTYKYGSQNDPPPTFGGVSYYIITLSELKKLIKNLTNTYGSESISDFSLTGLSGDMLKSVVSPMQYIKGVRALPILTSAMSGTSVPIYAGMWNTGAVGKLINESNSEIVMSNFNIAIPYNTESGGAPSAQNDEISNTYRYPPYADYQLINNMIGVVALDGNICAHADHLEIQTIFNLISGTAVINVIGPNVPTDSASTNPGYNYILCRKDIYCAIDVPISDISIDYVSLAHSTINGIGAAANVSGWVSNPGSNVTSLLNNAVDAVATALSPAVTSTGGVNSCLMNNADLFVVQAKFLVTIGRSSSRFGYPVGENMQLSSLCETSAGSGTLRHSTYIVASRPNIRAYVVGTAGGSNYGMYRDEIDMIVAAMASGFYVET